MGMGPEERDRVKLEKIIKGKEKVLTIDKKNNK
jgi:hypothetical protein